MNDWVYILFAALFITAIIAIDLNVMHILPNSTAGKTPNTVPAVVKNIRSNFDDVEHYSECVYDHVSDTFVGKDCP